MAFRLQVGAKELSALVQRLRQAVGNKHTSGEMPEVVPVNQVARDVTQRLTKPSLNFRAPSPRDLITRDLTTRDLTTRGPSLTPPPLPFSGPSTRTCTRSFVTV